MHSSEIRKRFLKFFEKRGHAIIPSASLIPENDPTTLFTGSGMQPMVPYLLGERHPQGTKIADVQKCFRGIDIEEVGDNRHSTFFEMLGNWSLGDYFKEEQLTWMFSFLIDEIGIDPNKLYITAFIGDEKNNLPQDIKSVEIWKKLFKKRGVEAKDIKIGSEINGGKVGMQGGRIFYYDTRKNWWSRTGIPENMPAGEPGGPDSEMFYEFTDIEHNKKFGEHCHPNCDCGRFLEIGNNVFMEYKKNPDGTFAKLPKQNVDFGGGLERMVMATENNPDIIATNHRPILNYLEKTSGKTYGVKEEEIKAFRVIADHMKAAVFLIADGINPSNSDQGYFVRRLIRRSVRYSDILGIKENILSEIVNPVVEMYKDSYRDVSEKTDLIKKIIVEEEQKFRKTLIIGLKEIHKLLLGKVPNPAMLSMISNTYLTPTDLTGRDSMEIKGKELFLIFTTYGFPLELSLEELSKVYNEIYGEKKENFNIVETPLGKKLIKEFKEEFKKHQELSRTGAEKKFKGGLGDTSEMSVKYHTTTHLLHQALRDVLGPSVRQRGSNITPERLRFDFEYPKKMTAEEKQKVEDIVNQKIQEKLPMNKVTLPLKEAEKVGALHFFGEEYGDEVDVYFSGEKIETAYSKEFCGGPHVKNTGDLAGKFKIQKEEAVSAGVRRIKAILE